MICATDSVWLYVVCTINFWRSGLEVPVLSGYKYPGLNGNKSFIWWKEKYRNFRYLDFAISYTPLVISIPLYEVLRAVEFLELESRIAMEEGESGNECLMDKEFVKMKKFWRWMVVVA